MPPALRNHPRTIGNRAAGAADRVSRQRGRIVELSSEGIEIQVAQGADLVGRSAKLVLNKRFPLTIGAEETIDGAAAGLETRSLSKRVPFSELVASVRGHFPDWTPADEGAHRLELWRGENIDDWLEFCYAPAPTGKVELYSAELVQGWAVDTVSPNIPVTVELFIDGVRYSSVRASGDRPDLVRAGITAQGGGFRLPLSSYALGETSEHELEVRAAYSRQPLLNGMVKAENLPPLKPVVPHPLQMPDFSQRGVTIIVPIYNAPVELRACLASLFRHTKAPARLLLIDDASPDPEISSILLEARRRANVRVLRNEANAGYTRTINRGLSEAGRDDVVLLNSDVVVTPGWLESLRVAAYLSPEIATVTPVSDNAGAFSVPEPNVANHFPPELGPDDAARLVRQEAAGILPSVPTGNGFCLFIRRTCLDAIGAFDDAGFPRGYGEENDFSMRAVRAGFRHIVDDRTLIQHTRSASFGSSKYAYLSSGRRLVDERYPEYSHLVDRAFNGQDVLATRWRVRRALARYKISRCRPKPRILYVISTTTGGTPQTNLDLMAGVSDRYEAWVLRCDTRIVELTRCTTGTQETVRRVKLMTRLDPIAHGTAEYDAIIAEFAFLYAFEIVHIRHIAWHSLNLPAIFRRSGADVIFSFHDYYAVCPTVKLLDDRRAFCGGTCTAGHGECIPELWPAHEMPRLKHRYVTEWRTRMSRALSCCDGFITTTAPAFDVIFRSFPDLSKLPHTVIPHGRDFDGFVPPRPAVARSSLRVLIPGNISVAKGAQLINEIAALAPVGEIELHILGDQGTVRTGPGVIAHGKYDRAEFADRVKEIAPDMGAIFSIWPETYSHTLTEMWACGLPVLGLDIGAVGERLRQAGAGWLLPVSSQPSTIVAELRRIKSDVAGFRLAAERVALWQLGEGAHNSVASMALRYIEFYELVRKSRLSFVEQSAA
ncbi:glycosyltransferase [Enterovirga sp. CN4-39]|uniref:glycosyltransferase n=1 Tax=Enterovirga sp. CN4-39 TaxID=3400910 RepID=UPI003C005174